MCSDLYRFSWQFLFIFTSYIQKYCICFLECYFICFTWVWSLTFYFYFCLIKFYLMTNNKCILMYHKQIYQTIIIFNMVL